LIHTLTAAAAEAGRSVYFLGGDPGTAQAAADTLLARHPDLRVAGVDCPPPGFEASDVQMSQLREKLHAAKPDIVYVALGSPKQEFLIVQLREVLPQAWFLGVGISFSFVCGRVRRAPKWVQRIGMEWAHRLVQEPGRLSKRYLIHGLPFAARLFAEALGERVKRSLVSRRSA
jgi:N-acetylglucosaminyldiphosphoundecaprenol N-acetyl-beta-D-mannosaminyltransferase